MGLMQVTNDGLREVVARAFIKQTSNLLSIIAGPDA